VTGHNEIARVDIKEAAPQSRPKAKKAR